MRKPCNECLQQGVLERWRSAKSPVRLPLRCLNSRKHRCEVSLKQAGLLTYLSPWACLPASAQMACSGLWWPRFGENHSSGYCRRFARRSLLIALHGAQTDSITAKLQQYFDSQSFFSIIPPPPPGRGDAGECQRRRSAAHLRRCVCPRRCRGLTEGETARAVRLRLWSSSASPKRERVCGDSSPMRPSLRSVRMGFLKNIASPMRHRLRWRCCEGERQVSDVGAERARVGGALETRYFQ